MSSDKKDYNKIPDSSNKTARGSKNIHSKEDDSTEDGFKPNFGKEEE